MRKATMCLLVILCSVFVFGQDQPQWKVVQSVILRGQTAPIPQTTLFTPQTEGVYRLSGYMSATGSNPESDVQFGIFWTDVTGQVGSNGMIVQNRSQFQSINSIVFGVRPGTPVTYLVQTNLPSAEYKYNLVFTIEQLQ